MSQEVLVQPQLQLYWLGDQSPVVTPGESGLFTWVLFKWEALFGGLCVCKPPSFECPQLWAPPACSQNTFLLCHTGRLSSASPACPAPSCRVSAPDPGSYSPENTNTPTRGWPQPRADTDGGRLRAEKRSLLGLLELPRREILVLYWYKLSFLFGYLNIGIRLVQRRLKIQS